MRKDRARNDLRIIQKMEHINYEYVLLLPAGIKSVFSLFLSLFISLRLLNERYIPTANDTYIIILYHIDINFLPISAFVQNRIYISRVRACIFIFISCIYPSSCILIIPSRTFILFFTVLDEMMKMQSLIRSTATDPIVKQACQNRRVIY